MNLSDDALRLQYTPAQWAAFEEAAARHNRWYEERQAQLEAQAGYHRQHPGVKEFERLDPTTRNALLRVMKAGSSHEVDQALQNLSRVLHR